MTYIPFWRLIEASQMRRYHEKLNFLLEGVRLGLDKEIRLDGTYLAYFPFSRMIERSRMTPYHKKLLEDTKLLTNLDKRLNTTIKLLGSVTCRYLNTDTCLTLWYYWVVETCNEDTLLLKLGSEVL